MEQLFPVVFAVLMAMVFVWFILLKVLFTRLERQHEAKYEQMGRPSLFWNNSMKTGLATLKFIGRREHRGLDDPFLSRLSDFCLVFFFVYLILFFGMFFGIPVAGMSAGAT